MCFIKEQHLKYALLLAYWVFTTVSNTMLLFKEKLSCYIAKNGKTCLFMILLLSAVTMQNLLNNHSLCRREKALWIL